jgi:DNA polymerase III alpha subunit
MEFGPIFKWRRSINKKSSSSEEYDKIKELIALAGEDDLGENYSASKSGGNLRNTGIHACGVIITQVILLILFLWLPPKIQIVCDAVWQLGGGNCWMLKMDFLGWKPLPYKTRLN